MHVNGSARSNKAENSRSSARTPTGRAAIPLLALQRSAGNAAVVQMLHQSGRPCAHKQHQYNAESGHQLAEQPLQRSTAPDVLHSPGHPLDDTSTKMEARFSSGYGQAPGLSAVQRRPAREPQPEQRTVRVTMGSRGTQVMVRCERKSPTSSWVVFVPSGMDPTQRATIAAQLRTPEDSIKFTNARDDWVELPDGRATQATEEAKVRQATNLVVQYMRGLGIEDLDQISVQEALERVSVTFHDPQLWEWVVRQKAFGSADSVEALTSRGPRGYRSVDISRQNYTFPAVVHELFHVLEHASVSVLEDGLVEGITEYWTSLATGVDYRCSRDGGRTYKAEVRFVRDALRSGYVTIQQLRQGYFHGDIAALQIINDFFTQFRRQQEATSFAYTGGR